MKRFKIAMAIATVALLAIALTVVVGAGTINVPDAPPNAKFVVMTDNGFVKVDETLAIKSVKIGESKTYPNAPRGWAKSGVFESDENGNLGFRYESEPGLIGTIVIQQIDGSYRETLSSSTGKLVAGDDLPQAQVVLLDKQPDAGSATDPTFYLWIGFRKADGTLIDVDDAEAWVSCWVSDPNVTLNQEYIDMFDKCVGVGLRNVAANPVILGITLYGQNGVVSTGVVTTDDTPNPITGWHD